MKTHARLTTRIATLAAALAAVAAAACTQVGTDPQSVVSIVKDTVATASVIAGDTLRDTSGAILPLDRLGTAFNGQGDPLPSAGVGIVLTSIDSTTPTAQVATLVRGPGADSAHQYLVAAPGPVSASRAVGVNLQYSRALRVLQRFEIVPRPDRVVRDTASATTVAFTDVTTRTGTAVFGVRVSYDSAGRRRPVRATVVKFQIVAVPATPANGSRIDSVRFVEATGRDSSRIARIDTTDLLGVASRSMTVYRTNPLLRAGQPIARDTITLLATVLAGAPGTRLPPVPITVVVVDSVPAGAATSAARQRGVARP